MESHDLHSLSPADLRRLIRQDDPRIRTTAGRAIGYQQANVVILPNHLANDFEAFCHRNPAPLPLLYCSQSGETSCPPIATDADIRTDVPRYCVFEYGCLVKTVSSLQTYSTEARPAADEPGARRSQWSQMVCFYLGCSFGFEGNLKEAGVPLRHVEQGTNVSMYRTAVPCLSVGVFSGPLVVSMRPVPASMLETAAQVTHLSPLAHGAPIHIGDPALLGIEDLSRPDYGDPVKLHPDDVPVFWACGVTGVQAILSSKPSLAFSHSPGCMFLTDIPDSSRFIPTSSCEPPPTINCNPDLIPLCILVSHNPLMYSLASQKAVAKIKQLQTIIGEEPGEREVSKDDFLRSCLSLSHSSSVAIITGFPTSYMYSHSDIPTGAIAMASMLLSLGKQVIMVTDRRALEKTQATVEEAVRAGVLKSALPLETFEDSGPDGALHFLCPRGDPTKPRYDHLVALEHSGRAEGGNKLKHLVDPIDHLYNAAVATPGITTTGVSNWGGYAVACGLYLLYTCPTHQRYLTKGLEPTTSPEQFQGTTNLPCVDKEELVHSILMCFGTQSGKTGPLAMDPAHSDIITKLLEVTVSATYNA